MKTETQGNVIIATPTWTAILPALIAALQNGTPEGQQIAREELAKLAAYADRINDGRDATRAALLDCATLLTYATSPRQSLDRGQARAAVRDAENALGVAVPVAHARD